MCAYCREESGTCSLHRGRTHEDSELRRRLEKLQRVLRAHEALESDPVDVRMRYGGWVEVTAAVDAVMGKDEKLWELIERSG